MEALIPGSRLLPEVEYMILESFDELRDLSNASLVCRTWRRLIFPHLHRDVVVSQVPHLEGLISRLESELPDSQNRIGSYLWSLQIDIGSRKTYGGVEFLDQLWTRLALCIPKLVNLESFRWNLLYLLPLDSLLNVFGAVRTSCPRLRRVSLSSWSHKYGPAETKKVFGFKNLTHLEVEWYVPERGLHPFGVPDGIIDVIENSPDLVHLSLDIHGSESWQPIDAEFFRRLRNPLAKLSQLKIGNQAYFDGSRLLCDPPQEQSFNWFFEQHPTLRGAHLHYHLQGSQPSGVDLSPATVQSLFRSITSFTGPVSLCTAVIQSPLANQLQSLKVIYGGPSHCSVAPFADAMKPLPLLRELHFLFHRHFPDRVGPVMYDYSTLGRILGMTPLLQTFGLDYWQVHLRLMTQYLSHVPLLSDLSIQTRLVDTSSVNDTSVAQLLETCPRLRRVRFIGEWHETQVFVCKPVWRQQSAGYI